MQVKQLIEAHLERGEPFPEGLEILYQGGDFIEFGDVTEDKYSTGMALYMPKPEIVATEKGWYVVFKATFGKWRKDGLGHDDNKINVFTKTAIMYLTRTPGGIRVLYKAGDGKTFWGFNPDQLRVALKVNRAQTPYIRWCEAIDTIGLTIGDVMPITKYMVDVQGELIGLNANCSAVHYYGIFDHCGRAANSRLEYYLNIIQAGNGVKAILNRVYDKTGKKTLIKSTFGGLGEIRRLDDLFRAIDVVRAMKDFPPHMVEKINLDDLGYMTSPKDKRYIINFLGVNEKTFRYIVQSEATQWNYDDYDRDVALMLRQIRSIKVRNAIRAEFRRNPGMSSLEFHNIVNREFNLIRTDTRKISVKKLHEMDGHQIADDIKTVTPKNTVDLLDWGRLYSICIGGYASQVADGTTYCLGFQKPDGTFWGFAEVSTHKTLRQLLGKHNQKLPELQKNQIIKWFKSIGVDCSNYWGK